MIEKNPLWKICSPSASQAFDAMRDQPPFFFPFLLVVSGTLVLWAIAMYPIGYYLFESTMSSNGLFTYSEKYYTIGATRLDLVDGFKLTAGIVMSLTFEVLKTCFYVGVRLMIFGTYFYAIARVLNIDGPWENWFSLSCWANIPMIVLPAMPLVIGIYSFTQHPPHFVLSLLWIGFCVFPMLWSVYITVQGLRSWTAKGTAFCVGVASAPYVLLLILISPAIISSFMVSTLLR